MLTIFEQLTQTSLQLIYKYNTAQGHSARCVYLNACLRLTENFCSTPAIVRLRFPNRFAQKRRSVTCRRLRKNIRRVQYEPTVIIVAVDWTRIFSGL